MLHITSSLKLDCLFDKFIEDLKSPTNWQDPFSSPEVIFSDIKVEKWFNLCWLKKSSEGPILMNLKTERLAGFVFDSLVKGIKVKDADKKIIYELLDNQLLKDGLIQKLISKEDGDYYYRQLNSPAVNAYVESKDGSVDANHLYDFASNMATLFSAYESTRSGNFIDGIHNAWVKDKDSLFFDFKEQELKDLETWQKKLYSDVLKDDAFCISNDEDNFKRKYVTLSQLVEINRESNDGKLMFETESQSIFIFGFNGMGNIYRELIAQMAADKDVYIFVQASDSDIDGMKNPVLSKWHKTGSENLSLWKKYEHEYQFVSGCQKEDTLLERFQKSISDNKSEFPLTDKKEWDDSIKIGSAPSALREIEYLHS
ncbi:MAG: exodeoxyribonuclease V subunit gamma, partial [Spirochaetales bacterium]|nr:exodeoxyribonuclease V subunit gamma [Spirochaetales bacterium]